MTSRPLAETLNVHRDARVAAIGGGGKMALLLALGLEWAKAGGRPLLLPTTRIADHAERGLAQRHHQPRHPQQLQDRAEEDEGENQHRGRHEVGEIRR